MDFESYYATDYSRAMLYPGVTRDWVDEGRLLKERIQLETIEALRDTKSSTLVNNMTTRNAVDSRSKCHGTAKHDKSEDKT
ncbi:hypothetical protein GW17_00040173, partial [Ensete ventricosum]